MKNLVVPEKVYWAFLNGFVAERLRDVGFWDWRPLIEKAAVTAARYGSFA